MTLEAVEAAPETRIEVPADASSAPAQVEETPAEDEVFATPESYLEHRAKAKESSSSTPESSKPQLRPNPLSDPRAGQYIQQFRAAHDQRQTAASAVADELVTYGVPEGIAKRVVKEFKDSLNAHHADGLRLSGYEAAATAVQYEQSHIQDAIASSLPAPLISKLSAAMQKEIDTNGVASYQTVMKNIVELAREGYVDEKTHKAAQVDAFKQGVRTGEKGAATKDGSNTAAGRVNGTPTSSGSKPKSLDEARSLHVQGKITNAEMRQYKEQFN